ncbi:hypothetical protein BU26DRAFT_520994 [Trematosphaeria pertusa]|uniref:F-box domain-containing protein n=1 Tax=Trematosphaeria pertusa TaxID=390896 RepID=A0A6A6I8Y1_9PLEO|nr:uncharacterized protein BU26DRAFT_520994 [Trematosphaeria pertusa]KAF2246538.1 hypothetical protein BU26DRAFT_520994 [Trematosphaeria pertusa]
MEPKAEPTDNFLKRLPDELIVRIAAWLCDEAAQTFPTRDGPYDYQDLLNSSLVDKQLARCGQEALVRHIDLTTRPYIQVVQLLRTLLEKPDLVRKIRSIRLAIPDRTAATDEDRAAHRSGTLLIQQTFESLDLSDELWRSWPVKQELRLGGAGFLIIPALMAGNLKQLELRADDLTSVVILLWLLSRLPHACHALFANLETLYMRDEDPSPNVEFAARTLLLLPKLKKLELSYIPVRESFSRDAVIEDLVQDDEGRTSTVEELTLNGWCPPSVLAPLFHHLTALRSLTYRPFPSGAEPRSRDFVQVWDTLLLLKHSLQKLHLEFPASEGRYYRIWPRNMTQFPLLTHFSITGRFRLIPDSLPSSSAAAAFLQSVPPNVEDVTIACDSATYDQFTATVTPQGEADNGCAEWLKEMRPMLRVLTVGRGLRSEVEEWKFAQDKLKQEGVTLRQWREEEERAFVERCAVCV